MVTFKNNTPIQQFWPRWRWVLTGLNTLALVLSVILSWHYLMGGSMIGCGGGSPCDQVLNSRWSTLAGVLPVSGLAMGIYLALLVASLYTGPTIEVSLRRLAWGTMLVLAGSVAGGAIWFTVLQKWFIGAFCPYCMTAHTTGLLLSVMVIWRAIKEPSNHSNDISVKSNTNSLKSPLVATTHFINPLHAMGLILIGLVLAGMLAAYQVKYTPSSVYHEGKLQDNLPVTDYHAAPMIGSPDAPYVVTLLFDYQCTHCRKIHFMLIDAVHRYNGKLAFVLCPAPLNTKCNQYIHRDVDAFKNSCELARIGLAVWVAKREALPDFENWMFSFDTGNKWHPRSLESVRAKAVELVGQEKFDAAWIDPWVDKYLQTCVQIYGKTLQKGRGGVPKLIFGSHWVVPELNNTDDLISILQKSLAVPKP